MAPVAATASCRKADGTSRFGEPSSTGRGSPCLVGHARWLRLVARSPVPSRSSGAGGRREGRRAHGSAHTMDGGRVATGSGLRGSALCQHASRGVVGGDGAPIRGAGQCARRRALSLPRLPGPGVRARVGRGPHPRRCTLAVRGRTASSEVLGVGVTPRVTRRRSLETHVMHPHRRPRSRGGEGVGNPPPRGAARHHNGVQTHQEKPRRATRPSTRKGRSGWRTPRWSKAPKARRFMTGERQGGTARRKAGTAAAGGTTLWRVSRRGGVERSAVEPRQASARKTRRTPWSAAAATRGGTDGGESRRGGEKPRGRNVCGMRGCTRIEASLRVRGRHAPSAMPAEERHVKHRARHLAQPGGARCAIDCRWPGTTGDAASAGSHVQ